MFGGKIHRFIELIIKKIVTRKDFLFNGIYKKIPLFITPNSLVYLRIFLALILFLLFIKNINNIIIWTAGIYIICKIFDILDGGLARYRNKITLIGQVFDPISDKLLNLLIMTILIFTYQLSALWIYVFVCLTIIILVFYDLIISLLKQENISPTKYLRRIIDPLGLLITLIFLVIEIIK